MSVGREESAIPSGSLGVVTFGSRGSELALTQSRAVAAELEAKTGVATRIEVISTRGDRELSKPLPEIGGKGLFTAELETALRDGSIDVAVHSLKDLPVEDPVGLVVAAIPPRASAHDVLVFRRDVATSEDPVVPLRDGARVGTSSPRRAGALRALRPDLVLLDIRGNVPTRVAKVIRGDYDAVVLAAAGLERLGLALDDALQAIPLSVETSPPAPGQGALGVQCRADDHRVRELLRGLHDERTAAAVIAERRVLLRLGGGCSMPLGAYASEVEAGGDRYRLHCGLFARDPQRGAIYCSVAGADPEALAEQAVARLAPFVEPIDVPVVLARPDAEPGELGEALATACPRLRVVASSHVADVRSKGSGASIVEGLRAVAAMRVLAFTSARAVYAYFYALDSLGIAMPADGEPRIFAVGPATCAEIVRHGHRADVPPADGAAAGGARLAQHLLASDVEAAEPIGFPCALDRHAAFEVTLREAGRVVQPLPLYRVVPSSGEDYGDLSDAIVVLTSPSGVPGYAAAVRSSHTRCVAIGETTAAACAAEGLTVDAVADRPEPDAVVASVRAVSRRMLEGGEI